MTLRTTFATALTAATIALGAPALAQQDNTMVKPSEIAAQDVTDAQIDAFVDALIAIEDVRKEYTPRLQAEEDESAREELAQEANEAALAAVDNVEGLSAADYLGIGKAASENEDLSARIVAQLEAKKKAE